MRILIMGAGGVGGYFGAQLARAGHEVAFVARGAHLAAIQANGLKVESDIAPIHLAHVAAGSDPAQLGTFDVVMFCTKLWDVEAGGHAIAPAVAPDGIVIPFQNGVEAHLMLRKALGDARVAGGVAQISATIKAPGVVAQMGPFARLRIGSFHAAQAPKVQAFHDACKGARIDTDLVDDIERALWEKFIFLASMAGLTALARQPIGVIRSDPDLRAVLVAVIDECVAVGRARNVALAPDVAATTLKLADALPAGMRASMAVDLERGNKLEAPWLAGAVVRMAREAGLQVPVNATIYAAMKPYLAGAAAPV